MTTTPHEVESTEALSQAVSVIHDELHKGNVAEAHIACHKALGIEDGPVDPGGRKFFRSFDIAFNTACRKNGVDACYVIFDHDNPAEPRKVRVLMGGSVYALKLLKPALQAGMNAIAEPMGKQ